MEVDTLGHPTPCSSHLMGAPAKLPLDVTFSRQPTPNSPGRGGYASSALTQTFLRTVFLAPHSLLLIPPHCQQTSPEG